MKKILSFGILLATLLLHFNGSSQITYSGTLDDIFMAPSCDSDDWLPHPLPDEEAKAIILSKGVVTINNCASTDFTVTNLRYTAHNGVCRYTYEDVYVIEDECGHSLLVSRHVTTLKADPDISQELPNTMFDVYSFDDPDIVPANDQASILQYLISNGINPPSCWHSVVCTMTTSTPTVEGCFYEINRYFTMSNGSCDKVYNFHQLVRLDFAYAEIVVNTNQMDDIVMLGSCSASNIPNSCANLSDFAAHGVYVNVIMGEEEAVTIDYEDSEEYREDGYSIIDRTYTLRHMCMDGVELHQKIKTAPNLFVNGSMKVRYYTENLPDAEPSIEYLEKQGLKIRYSCDKSELKVEFVEDQPISYGGSSEIQMYRRIYSVSPIYDYEHIEPKVVEELWMPEKGEPEGMSFITNNCTSEGAANGQFVITPPTPDDGCDGCTQDESYKLTLYWTDKNGKFKKLEYPDNEHPDPFRIMDLEMGDYEFFVEPNCTSLPNSPNTTVIYSGEFKITEDPTKLCIQPWMSFAGRNTYVELFSSHDIYDEYGKIKSSIIRDKDSGWTYEWQTNIGDFMKYCDEPKSWFDPEWSINVNAQIHYESGGYEFMRDLVMLKLPGAKIKANVTFWGRKDYDDRVYEKSVSRQVYFGCYSDSYDPNMIYGPTGYGIDSIIAVKDRIDYRISFENSPDFATAAASRVVIKCPLHEKADSKTLRLGQFGFGDFIYDVPAMASHYSDRIDLADTLGVWLDVMAGLDVDRNEVYWIFQSIDPETGVQPNDSTGFLPINDTLTGCGEGFVTFSVTTYDDTQTGDTITEWASILFDENDTIPTNTCTNMFDAVAPTSTLYGDTTEVSSNYLLKFKALAQDDEGGSGTKDIELYVNADKTQYVSVGKMIKDEDSDTLRISFNVGFSSLYQFICLATDNVDNKEAFKKTPEFEFVNNNPPTDIFLSNRFFDEDADIGTMVGVITTYDDQSSNKFEYSLVEGADSDDNAKFLIDKDRLMTDYDFRCKGDYSFKIRIQSKDLNGDSVQKSFNLYARSTATPPVTVVNERLCYGESLTFGGEEIAEEGVYYDTLQTIYGCDSVIKLNLIRLPDPVITYFDQPNCEGEDFEYEDFVIPWDSIENNFISSWDRQSDTTLVFKLGHGNVNGCIDTLWLNMLLHPVRYDSHHVVICDNGLPFSYGDSIFNESGIKFVHFTSVDGCDSIVTINLTVEPTYYNIEKFDTICDNEEYVIFSDTITEPGIHFVVGKTDVHHCDSVVMVRLTTLPTFSTVYNLDVCSSHLPIYDYEGFDITADAVSGEMTRYETAQNGCDSIIHLNLTVREADTQENDFDGGWNWYSTYLDLNEINVLQALEDSLGGKGEQIKSQLGNFAIWTGDSWTGTLTSIQNEQMYMIKTNDSVDVEIFTCLTTGYEHPITIVQGWNWIGYVSRYTNSTVNALGTLTPHDGDIIKSYDQGFAAYYEMLGGWFGSLTQMRPGVGYMYYSNNANDMTLVYPEPAKDGGTQLEMLPTHWNASVGKYPTNMTFIGKITIDNIPTTTDNLEVGVFCNGEVRGSGRAILMEGLGTYRLFMQVYGENGDELTFKLFDHKTRREHDAKSYQKVYFADNSSYGSIHDPYPFKFYTKYTGPDNDDVTAENNEDGGDSGSVTNEEGMSHELTLVPNPAKSSHRVLLYCDFTAEERAGLVVEVFNALGVKIQQIEPTRYPVQLNEIEHVGSYTVRVTTGTGRTLTKKLVVTR